LAPGWIWRLPTPFRWRTMPAPAPRRRGPSPVLA
jgi:hypothetical protein